MENIIPRIPKVPLYVLITPPGMRSADDLIDTLVRLDGGDDKKLPSFQRITLNPAQCTAVTKWLDKHPPPKDSLRRNLIIDRPENDFTLTLRYPSLVHRGFVERLKRLLAAGVQAVRNKDEAYANVFGYMMVSNDYGLNLLGGGVQHVDYCLQLRGEWNIGLAFVIISGEQRNDRTELIKRILVRGIKKVGMLVLFDLGPFSETSKKATVSKWVANVRSVTLDGERVVEIREVHRFGLEVVFRQDDGTFGPAVKNIDQLVLPMRIFKRHNKGESKDAANEPEGMWDEHIAIMMFSLCKALSDEEMFEGEKASGWEVVGKT